jgi:CheY-like chemotaxis protein
MGLPSVVSLSILVADDEQSIQDLLANGLRSRGHAVVSVGSAREAIRLLRDQPFDLVITDVVMPDGDGFELIAAFRSAQPMTRIVAISGGGKYLHGFECLRMARGLGAHAVVMKPFNWEQLQVGIEVALLSSESSAA